MVSCAGPSVRGTSARTCSVNHKTPSIARVGHSYARHSLARVSLARSRAGPSVCSAFYCAGWSFLRAPLACTRLSCVVALLRVCIFASSFSWVLFLPRCFSHTLLPPSPLRSSLPSTLPFFPSPLSNLLCPPTALHSTSDLPHRSSSRRPPLSTLYLLLLSPVISLASSLPSSLLYTPLRRSHYNACAGHCFACKGLAPACAVLCLFYARVVLLAACVQIVVLFARVSFPCLRLAQVLALPAWVFLLFARSLCAGDLLGARSFHLSICSLEWGKGRRSCNHMDPHLVQPLLVHPHAYPLQLLAPTPLFQPSSTTSP